MTYHAWDFFLVVLGSLGFIRSFVLQHQITEIQKHLGLRR